MTRALMTGTSEESTTLTRGRYGILTLIPRGRYEFTRPLYI